MARSSGVARRGMTAGHFKGMPTLQLSAETFQKQISRQKSMPWTSTTQAFGKAG